MRLHIASTRVRRVLFSGLGLVFVLNLAVQVCHLVMHWRVGAMTQLFDVDLEANLPTFFNVFLFFIAALLFYLLGLKEQGRGRRPWTLMACIFIFLGIDEGSQIHEKLMLITLRLMNHGQHNDHMGWLYNAWVIPYGAVVAVFGLILVKWFLRLPSGFRNALMISGVIYVFGAVVMEMYSGKVAEVWNNASIPGQQADWLPCDVYEADNCHLYAHLDYVVSYTIEETCEMLGLILCISALLKALDAQKEPVEIVIGGT